MSTFSTLNTLIEQKIANSSETFYDNALKITACNNTIDEILKEYDVPEFTKRDELTFDSDGLADKPTDYFRMVKLWETDSDGVQTHEFEYITPDEYDQLASTTSYYWTEDYIVAGAARSLRILPIDAGTVDIRYIITATDVEATGADDSGLSAVWDDAITYGACSRLFQASNRWDEAREFERLYRKTLSDTYLSVKNPGGIKANTAFKSKFARKSLLNR